MEKHIKTYILPLLEKYYTIKIDKKNNWNIIQINRKLKMWDEGDIENELITIKIISDVIYESVPPYKIIDI